MASLYELWQYVASYMVLVGAQHMSRTNRTIFAWLYYALLCYIGVASATRAQQRKLQASRPKASHLENQAEIRGKLKWKVYDSVWK